MSTFSYPIIRSGNVYRISQSMSLDQAEAVATAVKESSESADYPEMLTQLMRESGLAVFAEPAKIRDAHQDTWEGWVAHAPAVELGASNGARYKIKTRFSAVSCTEPNHSKVWSSILLLAYAKESSQELQPAIDLGREDIRHFFDVFSQPTMGLVDKGTSIYAKELEVKHGDSVELEVVGRHLIRAVGSKDDYCAQLEKNISEGKVVRLSDEISKSLYGEQALQDLLYFVFEQDITSVEEYERLVAQKGEQHANIAEADDQAIQPFEQVGLQWFGLEYDNAVALYSREETGAEGEQTVAYFGMCSEATVPTPGAVLASEKSSKALIELISPFL